MPRGQEILDHAAKHAVVLISVCSYCLTVYGFKPTQGADGGLSHGACAPCFEAVMADARACAQQRRAA